MSLPDERLAEYAQMCAAPSDAYSAAAWCEAANDLLAEVDRLRGELARAEFTIGADQEVIADGERERDDALAQVEALQKALRAAVLAYEVARADAGIAEGGSRIPEHQAQASDASSPVGNVLRCGRTALAAASPPARTKPAEEECKDTTVGAAQPDGAGVPAGERIEPAKAARTLAAPADALDKARETLTLADVQRELRPWQEHNFPGRQSYAPLLGALEELGELAHAHIKAEQQIRGTAAEHEAAGRDAVGDVIVCLLDYCNARGWDAAAILDATWREVRERDWQAHRLAALAREEPAE